MSSQSTNPVLPEKSTNPEKPTNTWMSWFRMFRNEEGRHTPHETRNVLLVICTPIAAVTFQAGVNPPGGVWQDTKGGPHPQGHTAGRAIFASQSRAYYVFLIFNTLALSTSILVILFLAYGLPFVFERWVAMCSMIVTYASAVFAVSPDELVRFRYILIVAAVPFLARFLIEMFKKCKSRNA